MLIHYRLNNFCSFNGSCEFSMLAPGGKVKRRFEDNYVETEAGCDLLKTAVIVGENAGGKSNFINSLKYLKSLFVSNSKVKALRPYMNAGRLQEEKNPAQDFELCFLAENQKIYTYYLKIDSDGIIQEKLQVQKQRKAAAVTVFDRNRSSDQRVSVIEDGSSGQRISVIEDGRKRSDERMFNYMVSMRSSGRLMGLHVSRLALMGIPDAMEVVKWMTEKLCPETYLSDRTEDIIRQEEDMKVLQDERFLDILRMVDYSICGIEIDDEKPYSKSVIIREGNNGCRFRRELQIDSAGVQEFFVWAVRIFQVVYENKVMFADEMDRVLNPVLSDRVISFIHGNRHTGQFIFSTHNVLHLDLRTYMKEQIYFITKDRENLASEMYSLSDFPEVRYETTKIYEFYLKGILGGTAFE